MLLALDTSTQVIGMALFDGVEIIQESVWRTKNHHSVEIAPSIKSILEKAGKKTSDLRCIAIAQGPGSFTSLRIGIAIAKGIALAVNIPLVAVATLDILAHGVGLRAMQMAAVLQAGRNRLAVQWYQPGATQWESTGDLRVCTAHELVQDVTEPRFFAGELNAENRQILARRWKNVVLADPVECVRRPAHLAAIGWKKWQDGQVENVAALSPTYLHIAGGIPG